MAASKGIINGSFMIFGLLFIISIFLGRAFCGWACPLSGLQDLCSGIRKKKIKTGRADFIKYILIWMPWLAAIVILAVRAGGYQMIDPFYMTKYFISVYDMPSLISMVVVLAVFIIIPLAFGNRAICHYICWMAPFMIIGGKISNLLNIPSLRLQSDKSMCTDCRLCSKECQMGLDVSAMVKADRMEQSECILCGMCADTCRKGSIKLFFGRHDRPQYR